MKVMRRRIFTLLILLATVIIVKAEKPVLKLYLPFDEGRGDIAYDKVSSLKADLHNTEWTEGKSGKGLLFNGIENRKNPKKDGSYVILPKTRDIPFFQTFGNGPFTIEAWIKPDAAKSFRAQAEIINKGGSGPGYRITFAWKVLYFSTGKADDGKKHYVKTTSSLNKVNLNEWNHIAVTRDKEGILKLYLNGAEAGKSKKAFEFLPARLPITIGAYVRGYSYNFKGIIDEVKIYQGAKEAEDILKEAKGSGENLSIRLDGNFNEPFWDKALKYNNFLIHNTGNKSKVQTSCLVNYDENYLYFGLTADEPLMPQLKDKVKENSTKVYRDDCLEIMLDADGNPIDYYHFLINPSACKGQQFRTQSGLVGNPWNNPNWHVAAKKYKDKWTAEVAIPFSMLNLEDGNLNNTISFNICRNRRAGQKPEESSIIKNGEFHKPAYFQKFTLKDIDLDKYNYHIDQPVISGMSQEGGKLNALVSIKIKNNSRKKRKLKAEAFLVSENGKIHPCVSSFSLAPDKEDSLSLNFKLKHPGNYQLSFYLLEGKKTLLQSVSPLKIEFVPLAVDVIRPFYRNCIYATEDIKEIKAVVKIGLSMNQISGSSITACLKADNGKILSSKKYTDINLSHNISLPAVNLADGKYTLTVSLNKAEKTLAETCETIYKLPPAKGTEVRIDKNLNMMFNGKPFLPIIWWGGSPYEEIGGTGADGIIVGFRKDNRKPLDNLQKIGLKGIVMLLHDQKRFWHNRKKLTQKSKEYIVEAVNLIKNHPALLAYYLVDEPEGRSYSPDVLAESYQLIRQTDPYHPILICNNSVNCFYIYANCLDMFFPDPYLSPTKNKGLSKPMSYISTSMENARKAGRGKKFVGITPQVFKSSAANKRAPTFIEERCMQFLAIVHGARGFSYYIYGRPDGRYKGAVHYPDLKIGIPYIIKEIKSLAPVILEGKDVKGAVSNPNIHLMSKRYRGKIYVFAVNILPEPVSAEINLPDGIKKMKVISENREINAMKNCFTDNFIPYGVHIYTDNLDFARLSPLSEIENKIKSSGGMFNANY